MFHTNFTSGANRWETVSVSEKRVVHSYVHPRQYMSNYLHVQPAGYDRPGDTINSTGGDVSDN